MGRLARSSLSGGSVLALCDTELLGCFLCRLTTVSLSSLSPVRSITDSGGHVWGCTLFACARIFFTEGRSLSSSESEISPSSERSAVRARLVHRRKIEASGTAERCSI